MVPTIQLLLYCMIIEFSIQLRRATKVTNGQICHGFISKNKHGITDRESFIGYGSQIHFWLLDEFHLLLVALALNLSVQ